MASDSALSSAIGRLISSDHVRRLLEAEFACSLEARAEFIRECTLAHLQHMPLMMPLMPVLAKAQPSTFLPPPFGFPQAPLQQSLPETVALPVSSRGHAGQIQLVSHAPVAHASMSHLHVPLSQATKPPVPMPHVPAPLPTAPPAAASTHVHAAVPSTFSIRPAPLPVTLPPALSSATTLSLPAVPALLLPVSSSVMAATRPTLEPTLEPAAAAVTATITSGGVPLSPRPAVVSLQTRPAAGEVLASGTTPNNVQTAVSAADATQDAQARHSRVFKYTVERDRSPFMCEVCGRGCVSGNDLNRHRTEVHLNKHRFACDQCDYRCARKIHLSNHKRAKHHLG